MKPILLLAAALQLPTIAYPGWDSDKPTDDSNHDGSEVSSSILLAEGLHPVRIYHRNKQGATPALSLSWSGPKTPMTTISAEAFVQAR